MDHTDFENSSIISLGQIELDPKRFNARPDCDSLPLLPTRNLVLFPGVTAPISLVRSYARTVVRMACETNTPIGVVCQKTPGKDMPSIEDLFEYGVVADVIKVFELPDGDVTAIIRGREKFKILQRTNDIGLRAKVEIIKERKPRSNDKSFPIMVSAVKKAAVKLLESTDGPQDLIQNIKVYPDPIGIVNMVCGQAPFSPEEKITLLAESVIKERTQMLLVKLAEQDLMHEVVDKVQMKARDNFEAIQRSVFLQQQMEAIRQELYGDSDDDRESLRKRGKETPFTEAARKVFDKELDKLGRLNPQSPDYSVQYSYLENLLDLPWCKYSDLNTEINLAKKELDDQHYGLKKVKERILEQIALLMSNPDGNAPILCFVGPPGVGKTSLGRSIATALGRNYQRVSFGGLHDEAEIRGHRRTYIGAMPGRIIDAIKRAGTSNPVLLLDEVDKIGSDFKGDPSAALLEVLDPEQNCHFHDNYIDIDYDLSKVLFIATANTLSTLSQPLLDRMEIIELSGYLLEEKVEIALRHIYPKLFQEFNLRKADDDSKENAKKPFAVTFTRDTIAEIIEKYTSESGVRQL
jgi:ATP-dependent Lon protease